MKWIPRTIALLLLWGSMAIVIVYIDPQLIRDFLIPGSYLPILLLTWITLWYSLDSFVLSTTIMGSIVLANLQLMHPGLLALLLLTLVIESWYIYKHNEKIHPNNEREDRKSSI